MDIKKVSEMPYIKDLIVLSDGTVDSETLVSNSVSIIFLAISFTLMYVIIMAMVGSLIMATYDKDLKDNVINKIVFLNVTAIYALVVIIFLFGINVKNYKIEGDAKLTDYDKKKQIMTIQTDNKSLDINIKNKNWEQVDKAMKQPRDKQMIHIKKGKIRDTYLFPTNNHSRIYTLKEGHITAK